MSAKALAEVEAFAEVEGRHTIAFNTIKTIFTTAEKQSERRTAGFDFGRYRNQNGFDRLRRGGASC
ncbi:MAG: hypothetical protein ABIL58_27885 [Pseudomonadota bacterium]